MAKVELVESFTRGQFARRLRALADALEISAGYRLLLHGREIIVPTTAKRWEIEYEGDEGKHEVEFTIKWGPRVSREEKGEEEPGEVAEAEAAEPEETPEAEALAESTEEPSAVEE